MDELENFGGRGDIAVMPVASFWNIAVFIVRHLRPPSSEFQLARPTARRRIDD